MTNISILNRKVAVFVHLGIGETEKNESQNFVYHSR